MESERSIWQDHYDHPGPWDSELTPLTLQEMLARTATRTPDAPLADFYGRVYTYRAVEQAARRVAWGLIGLGIKPGDRVGLYLPNVPHYIAAYYGLAMAGAVGVNFSPLYTADELCHQAEDSGTRILFTLSAKSLLGTALDVLGRSCIERLVVGSIPGVLPPAKSLFFRMFKGAESLPLPADDRVMRFSTLIHQAKEAPLPKVAPDDLALLQYTGGTTGRPKGAMITHQNLTMNAQQVNLMDGHLEDIPDRIIGVLPFFHVFANSCVLNRTIEHGGLIVMLPRFDARQVLAAVRRTRATSLPGVPTMFQGLLDCPDLATADLSSLRLCIAGAAPLPDTVKEEFERVTGARLAEGYGLTEASGVVSSNPFDAPGKGGTIGQPVAQTRVRLLDREDPTKLAAPGEPGELAYAGPQIMKGYWNNPEADKDVFVDGYLRSGDVGTIDEDGYIRIVDRLKDMIAVGGFKVFPSQIEDILYRHPAVREALVIGIPDAYRGESPKAFVTLKPELDGAADGEAIKAWLNPQLGKHERVVAVEIRPDLPKTLVGKLSRKELVAEEREKAGLA